MADGVGKHSKEARRLQVLLLADRPERCDGIIVEGTREKDGDYEFGGDYIVQTDSGFYGPSLADAQRIARCWNYHDELAEALRAALAIIQRGGVVSAEEVAQFKSWEKILEGVGR